MPLLKPGDVFPDLAMTPVDSEGIRLPDALAGHFGVVLFYRGSWCPYCNAQLRAFQRAQDSLVELDAKVVALSVDDEATSRALVEKHGIGPGWTLLQLLRHVGRGDRWAAQIITDGMDSRLDPRLVRDGKPPTADVAGTLRWLWDSPGLLLSAVAGADQNAAVWTFLGPKPAVWWTRRRLHEATVHRADVTIALGVPYDLPAELAADGISEWLDRLVEEQALGRQPSLPVGASMALRATDAEQAEGVWIVHGGERGVRWSDEPVDADVTLSGPVTDLFLATVRRRSVEDTDVRISGDADLWRSWLDLTPL